MEYDLEEMRYSNFKLFLYFGIFLITIIAIVSLKQGEQRDNCIAELSKSKTYTAKEIDFICRR